MVTEFDASTARCQEMESSVMSWLRPPIREDAADWVVGSL